jgi:hypothetical protein
VSTEMMSVWTDGNSWVVASSAEVARTITGMCEDDSPLASWEALSPDDELSFVMSDDEPLMLPSEPWEQVLDVEMRKQRAPCARWVEAVTSGRLEPYLGSMDW